MNKCVCREIMGMSPNRRIVLHLTGCPEEIETQEYDLLPWYKKITSFNPHRVYEEHIRQTIGTS